MSRTVAGVPSSTGEPSPTRTRTVASPSFRTVICSGNSTRALGSACLSFRARFTQNSTLRHSVSPRPSSRCSAPIASACHAPRPVLIGEPDVEDRGGRSELHRGTLADQDSDRRVPLLPNGHLLRQQHPRARLRLLVLPSEIHPEQHAPRRQRLEDLEAHHRPHVRVLHEDRVSRCLLDRLPHGPHLPSSGGITSIPLATRSLLVLFP